MFKNVCHFKFGVSEFFGSKNRSHHNVGRAAARIALCRIVYTFKPNKEVPLGAKYYITYLLRWSILPPYQFSSLPRTQFPFINLLHFVVNRAENEDIMSNVVVYHLQEVSVKVVGK